jgi:hypothetical protein
MAYTFLVVERDMKYVDDFRGLIIINGQIFQATFQP